MSQGKRDHVRPTPLDWVSVPKDGISVCFKLNWIEYCIMFYIVGRLVNEIRELWDQGPRDYCSQLWKILDFVMLSTFITSFSLKAVSYRYEHCPTVGSKLSV